MWEESQAVEEMLPGDESEPGTLFASLVFKYLVLLETETVAGSTSHPRPHSLHTCSCDNQHQILHVAPCVLPMAQFLLI